MVKKYEKSHPWLTFYFDITKASFRVSFLLGEAQSKCKHIAGTLLDPAIAQKLYQVYLAKGALATTAIEGNTLSEDEVNSLLEGHLELPKSKDYLKQEVQNIVDACNEIKDEQVSRGVTPLSVQEIKDFNTKVLRNLELSKEVIPGEIRQHSVTVGSVYRGAPAEDCEYLLQKLCNVLENDQFTLGSGYQYATGILKAILAHLYIAWIHPFGDGNGRTARLIEFKICMASGIPAPASHLLSNHYNETRNAYYSALDKSSKTGNPFSFVEYALQGYVDQLGEEINVIRKAQCKAFWTNYVYRVFQGQKDTAVNIRRRKLILDISEKFFESLNTSNMQFEMDEWMDASKVLSVSARTARNYGKKSPRVLIRDIDILGEHNLLIKKGSKIRPNFELLTAFVPQRADI